MTTMTRTPKPQEGMRFIHTGHCKGEREPECRVTRVSSTSVYYETATGKRASCDVMAFGGKVKSLVVAGQEYVNPYLTGTTRNLPFSDGK